MIDLTFSSVQSLSILQLLIVIVVVVVYSMDYVFCNLLSNLVGLDNSWSSTVYKAN